MKERPANDGRQVWYVMSKSAFPGPTFLGIGAPKAGTTWLHNQLAYHPDIEVPSGMKEIQYLNKYWDRGLEWYGGWFSWEGKSTAVRMGEITPHYLYHPDAPERAYSLGSVSRLILLVRDPIERAVSHYHHRIGVASYRGSFREFLATHPQAVSWGLYAHHLREWREYFEQEQFLIMTMENVFRDPESAMRGVADFLDVDASLFGGQEQLTRRVNASYEPLLPALTSAGNWVHNWMREVGLGRLAAALKRVGVSRLVHSLRRGGPRVVSAEDRETLLGTFVEDKAELRDQWGVDVSAWNVGG